MRRLALAILAAILPGCSRPDLSSTCATALAASARREKLEARATGSHLTIAGVPLNIQAQMEDERRQDTQWLVGIAVTASTPAGATLTSGSVGIGSSRSDAIDTAVAEWVQLAGVALVRSLVLKERSSERFVVGTSIAYPGATGIRGPRQPPWSGEDHARLLALVMPVLQDAPQGQPHSLALTLVVNPTGDINGDCRLDGSPSGLLLDAARQFPWPRLTTSYMFKQYYVAESTK